MSPGPQPSFSPPVPDRKPGSFWRIMSSSPITPREVRWAGIVGLLWFTMDVVWFALTLMGKM